MERKINRIKLYVKSSKLAQEKANILKDKLTINNYEIVENNHDLAISIGGDGTYLKMIHENEFNDKIIYLGINVGTLGFLPEVEMNDIDLLIDKLNDNDYTYNELYLEEATIYTNSDSLKYYSLNEFVIRKSDLGVLKTNIFIDNWRFW